MPGVTREPPPPWRWRQAGLDGWCLTGPEVAWCRGRDMRPGGLPVRSPHAIVGAPDPGGGSFMALLPGRFQRYQGVGAPEVAVALREAPSPVGGRATRRPPQAGQPPPPAPLLRDPPGRRAEPREPDVRAVTRLAASPGLCGGIGCQVLQPIPGAVSPPTMWQVAGPPGVEAPSPSLGAGPIRCSNPQWLPDYADQPISEPNSSSAGRGGRPNGARGWTRSSAAFGGRTRAWSGRADGDTPAVAPPLSRGLRSAARCRDSGPALRS